MSDILLLYASHYGQTRSIAARIARRLGDAGHEVDLVNVRDKAARPRALGYDMVILGSRIELGRHAPEILEFIRANRDDMRGIPTAFFSVSMAASTPNAGADPENYLAKTFALTDWRPSQQISFAGALPYRQYGWFLRQVMKRISRRAGHTTDTSRDHVFTDLAAVDAFADRLAQRLGPGEAVAYA